MREDRPHLTACYRKATRGCPASQDANHTLLSRMFCGGDIYAYSWNKDTKGWDIWRTEADWLATERNGRIRRPDLAEQGHGPEPWEPPVVEAKRLTKAQLVAQLAALDLPDEARKVLALA